MKTLTPKTLTPHHIQEEESSRRGIKEGWYAIRRDGSPGMGPFGSRDACVENIDQSSERVSLADKSRSTRAQ
jgi:hypothetical protein